MWQIGSVFFSGLSLCFVSLGREGQTDHVQQEGMVLWLSMIRRAKLEEEKWKCQHLLSGEEKAADVQRADGYVWELTEEPF